jgi:hypothetical protein
MRSGRGIRPKNDHNCSNVSVVTPDCDTAQVLEALSAHQPLNRQPPETSVESEDLLESKRLNTAEAARRKPSCQGRIKEENP